MSEEMFANNNRLDPLYLLGYHHFNEYMYNRNINEEE